MARNRTAARSGVTLRLHDSTAWPNVPTTKRISSVFISKVTNGELEEVGEWQSRPLAEDYAIVYFHAVGLKIGDEGLVRNKAAYVAVAEHFVPEIALSGYLPDCSWGILRPRAELWQTVGTSARRHRGRPRCQGTGN